MLFRRRRLKTIEQLHRMQQDRSSAWEQLNLVGRLRDELKNTTLLTASVTINGYSFTVSKDLAQTISRLIREDIGQRSIELSAELDRHGISL